MIPVAILGAGHWGPNFVRNFHRSQQTQVLWVIDPDSSRLQQVQIRFPDISLSSDPREAINDPRVEAVVIATPTSTHYELAKAALLARKHVLLEKPIATRVDHARELCELADKFERILLVGHLFLYNGAVQRVKDFLKEGTLGRVYYISMVRTNLGPIRIDVNAAWDLASHDISIANYWLGTEPLSASAIGGSWINANIQDAVFATLRYPNEVLVTLHASWLNPRKARHITVVGERRMLTCDDMELTEPIRLYDKQVTDSYTKPAFVDTFASFRSSVREGDILIPRVTVGEPLKRECDDFIESIRTGKQPLTGGLEGVAVVRVLEAIQRSIRASGREEKVIS